jgi:hypothetical protein
MRGVLRLFILSLLLAVAGCSSLRYEYHYVPGKTGTMQDGHVSAPEAAPSQVQAAVAAANSIAGCAYEYGGGHGSGESRTFDCSGAASYVLRAAGALDEAMPSKSFRRYGQSGPGQWLSVWAKDEHVFLVVAGVRYDTGWHGGPEGPRWTTKSRPASGYVIRHPAGL